MNVMISKKALIIIAGTGLVSIMILVASIIKKGTHQQSEGIKLIQGDITSQTTKPVESSNISSTSKVPEANKANISTGLKNKTTPKSPPSKKYLSNAAVVGGIKSKRDGNFINILDRGARGDGQFDNWVIFQKAVDSLANNGGGTIYIPAGSYAIFDKSIVIWGSNITLEGEDKNSASIIKRGFAGWFGECIDIAGKIPDYKYFGNFGNGNYKQLLPYTGPLIPAQNIRLKKLTLSSNLTVYSKAANTLGVLNTNGVFVDDCIIQNAPQTNVSLLNDTKRAKNGIIKFTNCQFRGSGQHSVRIITYNEGPLIGNDVTFYKCSFSTVRDTDSNIKEVMGKKILLWYRGSIHSGATHVKVDQCVFDDSGIIYANSNANGLTIQSSTMSNKIIVQHANKVDPNPSIIIKDNTFRNRRKLGLSLSAAAGNNGSVVTNSPRGQMSNNTNQDQ